MHNSNFFSIFAADIRVYMRSARVHMSVKRFALCLILLLGVSFFVRAEERAGTTVTTATPIIDTTSLLVQSGTNYVRIEPERLPATIVYMPDTAFGPTPVALLLGDTLEASMRFEDCQMVWCWSIAEAENAALVELYAHENAPIQARPTIQYVESWSTITGCDSIIYQGVKYTESGIYPLDTVILESRDRRIDLLDLHINYTQYEEVYATQYFPYTGPSGKKYTETGDYNDTTMALNGCNKITTIHLVIDPSAAEADTVFFCTGFNTQHEEIIAEGYVRRYEPYTFQSPSEWDYMDGVILAGEPKRTLVDLQRAEKNLYDHYVDGLTPIEAIRWSVCYEDANTYVPLTVTAEPQWVDAGHIAIQVQFRCGELYNTQFPTDIESIGVGTTPVKCLENGRVIILRGGERYTILGTKVQ